MTFPNAPLANQWTAGPPYELITSVKMNSRVDANFNSLLSYVNAQTRFFGSIIATAGAIGAATNIDFTGHIVEDTASGWNSTNKNWVCPTAGTYLINAEMKCNSTPAAPVALFVKNGTSYLGGPASASTAFSGQSIFGYVRLAVNDTISLRSLVSYATQNDSPAHNNFLQIIQISYV